MLLFGTKYEVNEAKIRGILLENCCKYLKFSRSRLRRSRFHNISLLLGCAHKTLHSYALSAHKAVEAQDHVILQEYVLPVSSNFSLSRLRRSELHIIFCWRAHRNHWQSHYFYTVSISSISFGTQVNKAIKSLKIVTKTQNFRSLPRGSQF